MHIQLLQAAQSVHALGVSLLHGSTLFAGFGGDRTHALLHVRFSDEDDPFPAATAQVFDPDSALKHLRLGRAWGVVICCTEGSKQSIYTWLMQVRQLDCAGDVVVLVLVDDLAGTTAAMLFRAGADLVLPRQTSPALVRLQLERLRDRLFSSVDGDLALGEGVTLLVAAGEMQCQRQRHAVPPQSLRLLATLARNPDRVLSIARLRMALDIPASAGDQALHNAVARLRRLLRQVNLGDCLQTLHGVGYRWQLRAPNPLLEA